jgi:2,5-diketo-D-gluconate reductase B
MEKYMSIENTRIPLLGLGTWQLTGKSCVETVAAAIGMGYRHLDTARIYGNENEVGKGIQQSGVGREEIFITTKISTGDLLPGEVIKATQNSLNNLNTNYIDLLLIHWPLPGMDLRGCLEQMFRMKDQGKVKHIGVSNFNPGLFKKAIETGPVICNQLEFSPYKKQEENLAIARESGLMITAYSPLGEGKINRDTFLSEIGKKYERSPAQVALRWLLQHGNVSVIPKASGEKHLKENMNIFDFELSDEDMQKISNR